MKRLLRPLGWLLFGLVIGAALGLYLGWVAWPTEFTEANPSILDEGYQQEYALMVAGSYALDGDLPAARRQLNSLDRDDLESWYLSLTVNHILAGENEAEIRQLVGLADALGIYSPAMDPYLPDGSRQQP